MMLAVAAAAKAATAASARPGDFLIGITNKTQTLGNEYILQVRLEERVKRMQSFTLA